MAKLYIPNFLRKMEMDVIVQPTEKFFINNNKVTVAFSIHSMYRYFQDFIESENIPIINYDNFQKLFDKHMKIYNEFQLELSKKQLIFIEEENDMFLPRFYINKAFIEMKDIINCCNYYMQKYNSSSKLELYVHSKLVYKDGQILDTSFIDNNYENEMILKYLMMKEKVLILPEYRVKLFLIDKWVYSEMIKDADYPKSFLEFFQTDFQENKNDEEDYFTFKGELLEDIKYKIMEKLNIRTFLENYYGKKESDILIKYYQENPYRFWKW